MHNLFISLIFFLPFFFYSSFTLLGCEALTGSWQPIHDVSDPTVVSIGKFAVDEHNKEDHASLKFSKVVSGEFQVVVGFKYNLSIAAADGNVENKYVALVWDKPEPENKQLLSFKGPI